MFRLPRARLSASKTAAGRRKNLRIEPLEPRVVFAASDLDLTFGGGDGIAIAAIPVGSEVSSHHRSTAVQVHTEGAHAGKIVVAGTVQGATTTIPGKRGTTTTTTDPGNFGLVRFDSDGPLDIEFGTGGLAIASFSEVGYDTIEDLAITADGKYVAVGRAYMPHTVTTVQGKKTTTTTSGSNDFAIARFNADGSLDTTFSGDGKANIGIGAIGDHEWAHATEIQPDGKIVVAGVLTPLNGAPYQMALVRLHPDGTLDATFGSGGKVTTDLPLSSDSIRDIALQTIDGETRILAIGSAGIGPEVDLAVVRYRANGALDTSFGAGGFVVVGVGVGQNDTMKSVVIQPDNKIVIAGSSVDARNLTQLSVVRLEVNGTLDAGFGVNGRAILHRDEGHRTYGVALQADGKIVVSGESIFADTEISQNYQKTMAVRFLPDGSLDSTFGDAGVALWDVNPSNHFSADENATAGLVIQPDGKILIAGKAVFPGAVNTHWTVLRLNGDSPESLTSTAMASEEDWTNNELEALFNLLLAEED